MRVDIGIWKKCGLLMPYYDIEWDDSRGDAGAYEQVQRYIKNLPANRAGGIGVVLVGPPGTGKTLMAHHIAAAALENKILVDFITMAGYQQRLQLQMDYMRLIENLQDPEAGENWWAGKRYLQRLRTRTPLLLLDDVGKEHITGSGFIQQQFDRLMRARGNKGLPTVVTTNILQRDWLKVYGASMSSYFKQVAVIIPVLAQDHRERR